MTEQTVVQQLAQFARGIAETGLPTDLRHDVVRRIADVLGNAVAAKDQSSTQAVVGVATSWGGHSQAVAIGTGTRLPAAAAALVNGTLAHSMDFDDTHLPSVLHPSASVVPTALAVGEKVGASGAAILDAAGVGIEVTVRLGMGGYDEKLGNSVFFERGQHATSICGAVGSAVTAAMLYGLNPEGIAHSAGIASSMGAGLLEANRTGGTVKRVHCGWAAHAAVSAAELALHGLTGPPTVIEGRFGFLEAFCGDGAQVEAVTDRLGDRWELSGIFFKPYPCNHFTHAGVDAALELRARGVNPDDIDSLELGVPSPVLRTIGEPAKEKARPRSGYHAAFSGPYTLAAALVGGGGLGVFHEDFTDEAILSEVRLRIADKVTCVADARCDEIFPHQFPAVLRATLNDGTVHEIRVDANRGGPQRPLSEGELATKVALNLQTRFSASDASDLAKSALAFETLDGHGVSHLMGRLL